MAGFPFVPFLKAFLLKEKYGSKGRPVVDGKELDNSVLAKFEEHDGEW
jgi:hypothetical protein